MSDYLLRLSGNPFARRMVKRLGLPVPMPTNLRRADGPWEREPILDRLVVVADAAGTDLAAQVARAVVGAGARTAFVGHEAAAQPYLDAGREHDRPPLLGPGAVAEDAPVDGLVFDASGAKRVEDLTALYNFFHGWLGRVARSGRIVVVARDPRDGDDPEEQSVRAALEGFIRSVAKEVGRKGATAQLITVATGADARAIPPLRWVLSDRSAFVSGQVIRVSSTVAHDAELPFLQPLAEKTALVTGAARGIGESIAACLAREGAAVVCLDRPEPESPLGAVAARIGGTALEVDITSEAAAAEIQTHLEGLGAKLDILVHNAGVTRDKTLARMKPEAWDQALQVNLAAITRLTPRLLEAVVADDARIVCLSSIAGISGNYGQTNYAASKSGVIGYVKAMAPRLGTRGIAINAIAPGFIETRMTAAIPAATREVARRMNALSQGGRPQDVAELATFLSTPGAVGVTGQVIRVCGMHMVGA